MTVSQFDLINGYQNHKYNYKCPSEGNCPERKKVPSWKQVQSLVTTGRMATI